MLKEYTGGTIVSPALVYVYVDWCGYCKRATPVIHKVADQLGSSLTVVKINGDDHSSSIPGILGRPVKSYPTIAFIDRSGRAHMFDGERTVEGLTAFVCQKSSKVCGAISYS